VLFVIVYNYDVVKNDFNAYFSDFLSEITCSLYLIVIVALILADFSANKRRNYDITRFADGAYY